VTSFVYSGAAAGSCTAVAAGEWPGAAPGGAAAGGGTRRGGRGSQVGPLHQVAPEKKKNYVGCQVTSGTGT
jgi:hypothetical protein